MGIKKKVLALSMAAIVAFSGYAQPAEAASPNITFSGKGNGHGVGMSQWGAKGMADKKQPFDVILKHYYTGVKIETKDTDKQKVRVAIGKAVTKAPISATTNYSIRDSKGKTLVSLKAGDIATIYFAKGKYQIYSAAHKKTFTSANDIFIVPLKNGAVRYKNLRYDGQLHLYQVGGKMYVVNHVLMEDYVAGVLPYEMYASWPAEALKAQSVAARTYSMKRVGSKGNWDMDDTITYQVYRGKSEHEKRMKQLTNETKGQVLTYGGKYIDALFYASSGGHTVSAQYVWRNAVPYLRGKSDPYDASSITQKSWTHSISKKQLGNAYGIGPVKAVKVLKMADKRPVTISLVGSKKTITVSAHSLRSKLGGTNVKSTYFTIRQ